jgi:hypothetical protein
MYFWYSANIGYLLNTIHVQYRYTAYSGQDPHDSCSCNTYTSPDLQYIQRKATQLQYHGEGAYPGPNPHDSYLFNT